MKNYIITLLVFLSFSVKAQINTLTPGNVAPPIKLVNVDGKTVGFSDFPTAKGFIIVFTCNTCPMSHAYEQRIIALNAKYSAQGYPVIAVNPNDPAVAEGDSFLTNLYGAIKTPHLFLAKKQAKGLMIEYVGAIDDDPEESKKVRTPYVEDAIKKLNENQPLTVTSTRAIGCTVKRAKTTS